MGHSESFFGVQNFEFQYFLVFRKNDFFYGYEGFEDMYLWSSQIGLYLGAISMQFVSFPKVKVQMGVFVWIAKNSNTFLGCLKFLIYFGVNSRCWARAYA